MNETLSRDGSVRCVVMRGGTTRGVFFDARDLPSDAVRRDAILMAVIGGPDPRQVDGLGGADLLLSKVALVWPSRRPGTDVECQFGSITPGSTRIKYGANCGNLSSAVACFARQLGLVPPDAAQARLFNPDSGTAMVARWPAWEPTLREEMAATSGMPVSGDLVEVTFLSPAATATGRLLPTGRPVDCLAMPDGRTVSASIVDAGALYVFLRADEVGLADGATTDGLRQDADFAALCEYLRGQAAVLTGLVNDPAEALAKTPAVPKLSFVRPPADFRTEGRGLRMDGGGVDLIGRIVSSQAFHKAYAVTGAIATAAAAAVPGSVVSGVLPGGGTLRAGRLRIGHPTGLIECAIDACRSGDGITIRCASVLRTARRIMEGCCELDARRLDEIETLMGSSAQAG
jgi:2-methylaconitate cis-trans-isomerase PrpF